MTIYRLRETHPTAHKLKKLFEFMEELGLSLLPESNGRGNFFLIKDREQDFPAPLELVDLEVDGSVDSLPPTFEYKLVYDKR